MYNVSLLRLTAQHGGPELGHRLNALQVLGGVFMTKL